eukprot:3145465-Pleurochrysis_carterae.AAC.1
MHALACASRHARARTNEIARASAMFNEKAQAYAPENMSTLFQRRRATSQLELTVVRHPPRCPA